ncbi:YegS/Rv2252/BmrU family lipid kinase [Sporosarcina sp. ACRSL]|uniref:diacylglycerol/lipid kinase family protein n=1 Tax=Sporosarcina sp. ACRSL TaxID=2918215 RepID=UPI001EF609CA|nr:YegS/Rv2252/BmrU family lipid kinase [Sporosarcina sp. ACRSL]MCG7345276.1 YegS/Rv2252/BmrU family lipid kinase [Sporosarcina sp. ACRSL]
MYIFIINPTSGKERAFTIWQEIEEMLLARNVEYETHICVSSDLTRKYMKEKMETTFIKAFVVIGGDGTINSVIQQLAHTPIPLAVLPAGSGNDVARNFNLVTDPDCFVKKLLVGKCVSIDLLKVNGLYGLTIAGVGIDAKIGNRADKSIYKKWLNKINRGSVAYTIAAIIELLTFTPFRAKLFVDGQLVMESNLWLAASGNVKMYGGGLVICPNACPTDGMMNVTVLHEAKRLNVLLRLFPLLLKGKPIIAKEVSYLEGKEIVIEGERMLPSIIDGEFFHSKKIKIAIQRKALNLILTS